MKIQRNCKVCETPFLAIKETQQFCERRCFKRDYYLRTRRKMLEELANPTFPKKKCDFCLETSVLDFDPIKFPKLFNNFKCLFCNVSNILVWTHSNNPNSHQIISENISSVRIEGSFQIIFE